MPPLPNPPMPGTGEVSPEQWDASISAMREAWAASSGLEQRKLEAQIRDAEEGRKNSMAIARLQAATSRYGVDAQRDVALKTLKQRAYEFEKTHELELKRFGVQYADTAAQYLSVPDRYFQAGDFLNMAGRVFADQPGVAPYGSTGTPTPKNESDFAVLAGGGNPLNPNSAPGPTQSGTGAAPAAASAAAAAAPATSAPSPSTSPAAAAQGTGAGADARVKAIDAVLKSTPLSGVQGLNDTDFTVLQAIKSIAELPQAPGTVEAMRPGQQKILMSGLQRLGYYAPDWIENYQRSRPGQGNVRMAG